MSVLAINGGEKVRKEFFPAQQTFGEEEKNAVNEVLDSGILSGYRGSWSPAFWGGINVQQLERKFAEKFKVTHAIACNSCTSALLIACKALDLFMEKEVLVTPWSMSCSASAPLICNAIPIFADIEEQYFCLDFNSIQSKRSPNTKAAIIVDLFGLPFDKRINEYAEKFNIKIIEDAAQAIGATRDGQYTGTLGDIGVFSFTQGKILASGEGGMITTNDSALAMKCRLLMNHAEAVIHGMSPLEKNLKSIDETMWGMNLRMTEIQAAILKIQLDKLDGILLERRKIAYKLYDIVTTIVPAITPAPVREGCTHSYYTQPFLWNSEEADGLHRDKYIEAVKEELMPEQGRLDKALIAAGYIDPLYKMPLFQGLNPEAKLVSFPNVENLWKETFFYTMFHGLPLTEKDLNDICAAFEKVWEHKGEL